MERCIKGIGSLRKPFKLFDLFTLFYLAIVALLSFIFGKGLLLRVIIPFSHLVSIVLIFVLIRRSRVSTPFWDFLRNLYPLVLLPLVYEEIRFVDHLFFKGFLDSFVVSFERDLLGFHPNLWISSLYSPFLTEIMTFFYFSYYFMVFIPPVVLWLRKDGSNLERFMNAVMLSYYVSFLFSITFPVESPRFFLKSFASPQGFYLTKFHDHFMAMGSFRGNGMPSSHVAATLSSVLSIKEVNTALFWVMFVSFLLMSFSTIYGGYHYLSDVLGGVVVGFFSFFITNLLSCTRKQCR